LFSREINLTTLRSRGGETLSQENRADGEMLLQEGNLWKAEARAQEIIKTLKRVQLMGLPKVNERELIGRESPAEQITSPSDSECFAT